MGKNIPERESSKSRGSKAEACLVWLEGSEEGESGKRCDQEGCLSPDHEGLWSEDFGFHSVSDKEPSADFEMTQYILHYTELLGAL